MLLYYKYGGQNGSGFVIHSNTTAGQADERGEEESNSFKLIIMDSSLHSE